MTSNSSGRVSTCCSVMSAMASLMMMRPALRAASISAFASFSPLAALVRSHCSQVRSEEHTSELQSQSNLVCRLLLEKKNILKHKYPFWQMTRTRFQNASNSDHKFLISTPIHLHIATPPHLQLRSGLCVVSQPSHITH